MSLNFKARSTLLLLCFSSWNIINIFLDGDLQMSFLLSFENLLLFYFAFCSVIAKSIGDSLVYPLIMFYNILKIQTTIWFENTICLCVNFTEINLNTIILMLSSVTASYFQSSDKIFHPWVLSVSGITLNYKTSETISI